MSVGSDTFDGIDCQVTIKKKGGTGYTFGGRISGYDRSGFERSVEYEACQGLYVEDRKPITPATVSFDVIVDVDSDEDILTFSDTVYKQSSPQSNIRNNELDEVYNDYKISIEFVNYTATYGTLDNADEAYKEIYYNAKGINFDKNADASGYLSGNINFKVAPFNSVGSSNYLELEKTKSGTTTDYASAESSKDSEMGY